MDTGGTTGPPRGQALASDTHGALELPWVFGDNPSGKGVLLLLLGPQAVLTANVMPFRSRPRLLEPMAAGWERLPSPLLLPASLS